MRTHWQRGGRGFLSASLFLASLCIFPVVSSAQATIDGGGLNGVVLRNGEPVAGVPVSLNRVVLQDGAPVASSQEASAISSAAGRFRFNFAKDTTAVFVVTADYLAIRYIGPLISPFEEIPSPYSVEVYDTTSTLSVPLRVSRRAVVLTGLDGGAWEVNELVSLSNESHTALVARPGQPTALFRIPAGATDFVAGERDFLPHQITRGDNAVMLLTPFPPGVREMHVSYRLPGRPTRATVPILEQTDTFDLIVQQSSHLRSVVGLQPPTRITADGVEFLEYSGFAIAAGTNIEFGWSGGSPVNPVLAAVIATLGVLGFGLWSVSRNRSAVGRA